MKEVKKFLEQELLTNICPFWEKMVDMENGGFYGATDENYEILKTAPKGVVYISRILFSYSFLYLKYKDEKYLKLAQTAYRFMIDKLNDQENGGFYWSTSYDGEVLNDHKHLYGNSFALYGLSAYYIASNDLRAIGYASQILKIIENAMIDFPNNYFEEYSRDFKPLPNRIMEGFNMVPEITTNTLLHLAEALSLYYSCLKNPLAKELTIKILNILFEKGYDHENKNLYQFLNYKLENQIEVYSYGHNLEVSWLFMDVMKLCGYKNEEYTKNCIEMFERNYELSFNGKYIINETVNGVTDNSAIWWVQAEALVALNNVYNITNCVNYKNGMKAITQFIKKHFVNENKEWHWGINEDMSIQTNHSISEMWKANYHNVRAILKVLEDNDGE